MLKTLVIFPMYITRRWGVHLFILGVSIFLLLLVQRRIYEHLSSDTRYFIDLSKYQMVVNPEWLIDETLKRSIANSLALKLKIHIFEPKLLERLSKHYQVNPWVSKIELIERRLPHDLRIKLELRRPFIAVVYPKRQGSSHYYLVDKQLIRLPGEYKTLPVMPMPLPVVVGIKEHPPRAGQRWDDRGLRNAITITQALEEEKLLSTFALARIDVTNLGGTINPKESEIILWTRNNIPIQWGRALDTDKFGELSLQDKIKNLKLVLEVCPELKGIRYVKLHFDQPYIALEK